jgi:hypothetical protein
MFGDTRYFEKVRRFFAGENHHRRLQFYLLTRQVSGITLASYAGEAAKIAFYLWPNTPTLQGRDGDAKFWWARLDLNQEPADYESDTLTS